MAWKTLGAVAAALLLHGCIDGSDSSGGAPVRWDSAGVTVVENHGETLMLDWVKDVGLQLGGNEQGEDSFHRVTRAAIATDDLGSLYVLDPDARRLVVFDESGDFSWEMGREGDGPGEFRLPIAVAVVGPGREAWIYDIGSGRLTAVRDHGEVVTSRRIDNETVSGLGVLGGGLAYSLVERVAEGGEERLFVEDDGDTRLLHARRVPASRVIDLETCGMRIPGLAPIFSLASMNWSSQGDRVAVFLCHALRL